MGLATTLQLVRPSETGFIVPGIFYTSSSGKPEPVVFKNVGQLLDLTRVDIPSYVAALQKPEVKSLTENGTFMLVQAEVSEKIEQTLRNEQAKSQTVDLGNSRTGHGHETAVVVLEPGLHVAVGAGGFPQSPRPLGTDEGFQVGANATKPTAVEIEPGLAVAPAVEKPAPAPVEKAVIQTELPAWKQGLTFDQQQEHIRKSKDTEFLQSVINDSTESLKLKRIAKETLAKLKLS